MKVSILICTYNRCELLEKVLNKLTLLHGIGNHEVIVIDNNSLDRTSDIVQKFIGENKNLCVKYIVEARQGLSYARNTGIESSAGDIVAFLDDDAFPCENWIHEILDAFSKYDEAVAIGGKIVGLYEIEKPYWIDKDIENLLSVFDLGGKEKELKDKEPVGANMAIRRDLLGTIRFSTNLGRIKKSLLSGEETYMFAVLRLKGKVYYIPSMRVDHFIHAERLTKEWVLKRIYFDGVSQIRMRSLNHIANGRYLLKILLRGIGRYIRYFFMRQEDKKFKMMCKLTKEKGMIDEYFGRTRV